MHKISLGRILAASLVCLSAVAPAGLAQSGSLDTEAKNYKLSMDRIKAYDSATLKLKDLFASDPASQSGMREAMKKGGMMAALENNPKILAVLKSAGISAHEFLIIPSCVQVTASVYNSQAQGSAMGAVVSPDNLAFYAKNKTEIDKFVKNWQAGPGRK